MKHNRNLSYAAFALGVLFCLPMNLPAQSGQPEEVRKAQALIQAKDYDSAIKILEEFLKANPARPAAWNLLGTSYLRKGEYDKALQSFAKANTSPQFRIGIEAAGDVNADRFPDVIASAPGAGRAYVYSGKDGKLLLTLGSGDVNETFGRHVSGTGDINGDGHSDVIVGAPGNSSAGQGAGRAYVYSGKDGAVLLTLDGEKGGDAFGSAVAGYANRQSAFLIAGAPNAGPKNTGRVYVYAGLSNKPKFIIDADETGAQLGAMFLSVVGDVNRDKVPDIYASDFSNTAKGSATGRVYVHSGADGRRLLMLTGESANDGFGIGPADAGDVNNDGHDDLIVGAWQHSAAAPSGGITYIQGRTAT